MAPVLAMKPTKLFERIVGRHLVSLLFEPRDLWLGAYWDIAHAVGTGERQLYVYLCALPCLPLRFRFELPRGAASMKFKMPLTTMILESQGDKLIGCIESIEGPGIRWTLLDEKGEKTLDTGVADDTIGAWEELREATIQAYARARGVTL